MTAEGNTARKLVIAVDCSTTAAKAIAHDGDRIIGEAAFPLTTSSPQSSWHEQQAPDWWTSTRAAIAAVVAGLDDPTAVAALCLTHQRESFVCLDAQGRALRPAILWLDARAHVEIAELGSARVHQISGKPPDTTPAIYKLAWLARHEPEVLARAAKVGDVQAYLGWQLTGRWATSEGSGDTLGLVDASTRAWSPELVALAGVQLSQLPDLVPTGELLGRLTAEVAADLGLPTDTPVVAGIGDGQAAGLALGFTETVAYLNLGTSMVMGLESSTYVYDPAFRTLIGPRPDTYVCETVLNAAAYVASWCREQFGGVPGGAGLAEIEAAASAVPAGSEGLITLPYWNAAQTPHWDPLARGAVVGWHGRHTPAHFYRSILEGVALELRVHLERLEAATGKAITAIRAVGGGARSALWVQIIADVTGRPVRVCSAGEASAAGAALIGFTWLDRSTGGEARGSEDVMPAGHDVVPGSDQASYDLIAAAQARLYPQLREVFVELAQVREMTPTTEPSPSRQMS